jgi:hypothetical protein
MTRWEYTYMSLHREPRSARSEAAEAFSEIRAEAKLYGEMGWEAVGEIAFTYGSGVVSRVLMLKRPLPDDEHKGTGVG